MLVFCVISVLSIDPARLGNRSYRVWEIAVRKPHLPLSMDPVRLGNRTYRVREVPVGKPHLPGTAPTVYSFGENSLALT